MLYLEISITITIYIDVVDTNIRNMSSRAIFSLEGREEESMGGAKA